VIQASYHQLLIVNRTPSAVEAAAMEQEWQASELEQPQPAVLPRAKADDQRTAVRIEATTIRKMDTGSTRLLNRSSFTEAQDTRTPGMEATKEALHSRLSSRADTMADTRRGLQHLQLQLVEPL